MAKAQAISDEAKKKEQEKKDRETRDKKEQEQREKEKKQKQKRREKLKKKKEKKERKRIREAINFPFKTLLQASSFFSLILFIIMYWGNSFDIQSSVFNSFMLFISLYFGVGVVLVAIFFVISEQKKKELEEQKIREEEQRLAEMEREKDELDRIDSEMKEAERQREEELRSFRDTQKAAHSLPEQNKDLDMEEQAKAAEEIDMDSSIGMEENEPALTDEEKMFEEEFLQQELENAENNQGKNELEELPLENEENKQP